MNDQLIIFEDVSKFYGEILGVNRVNLTVAPGITSLVGPNGSGKTTLMNLMTGLIQPTRGRISVLGVAPSDPQELFRKVVAGYRALGAATQREPGQNGLEPGSGVLGGAPARACERRQRGGLHTVNCRREGNGEGPRTFPAERPIPFSSPPDTAAAAPSAAAAS